MTTIKGKAKLKRIMYPRGVSKTDGGYTIASFIPIEMEQGSVEEHPKYGTFSLKGNMPPLKEGKEYYFIAEEGERHPQFGISYELAFMRTNIELDKSDIHSVRRFLEAILTKKQAYEICDALEDPIKVMENKDINELTKVRGIGLKTAQKVIDHYDSQRDYSFAYIELGKYDLRPKTIKKVTDFYRSPELAVSKILENPYKLMEIDGYGFKTCDKLFLKLGGSVNAEIRIKSFLIHTLHEQANAGNTWITPKDLFTITISSIPNADTTLIGDILLNSSEFYLTEDKMRISLAPYQNLEESVSRELMRILEAENTFEYDGWEDEVAKVEEEQGWSFTEQQKEAMLMMLESNVSILQGYGGTGKTTTLKAVADILEANGYIYAQTALSGKASNNLTLVTGKDGSTIHRLLKFNPIENEFFYNSNNPLPYDIIIIDEISMVDAKLFCHLLLAVRTGAKIIMLGDSEQLESIGIPVMVPMIQSGVIPTMTLTQIHRQAEKSAVVTDSIAIRQGKQIVKETEGRVVHGELQDLEYELVSEDEEIFIHAVREFHKYIQTEDILDVQILSQTRTRGKVSCLRLNLACQKIYNPAIETKKEVLVGKKITDKGGVETGEIDGYYLREGDKVMNIRNNYNSVDEYGNASPVFNGNIGILERIDEDEEGDEYLLINFEGIGRVRVYKGDYNTIELAYCITVHKSQGSSSKIVIIALPFHFMLNTRQLFYTAITRTRKHCVVITTKKTIVACIKKNDVSNKRTYLAEYLKDKVASN